MMPIRTARPLAVYRAHGFSAPIVVTPGWRTYAFAAVVFPLLVVASAFAAWTADGFVRWVGGFGLLFFGGGGVFYLATLARAAREGALTLTEAGVVGLPHRPRGEATPWADLGPAWAWDQRTAPFSRVRHVMFLERRGGPAPGGRLGRMLAAATGPAPDAAAFLLAGEPDARAGAMRLDGALAARRRDGGWAQGALPATLDTPAREEVATIINLELLRREDTAAG